MRVYLDNNATTPLAGEVQEAIKEALGSFGNPSSSHEYGRQARELVEEARGKVAALINVDPSELIFTSGGSESNNVVIKGTICRSGSCVFAKKQGRAHIITSKVEHPCVLESCRCMEHEGAQVTYLPVDEYGRVSPDDLKDAIKDNTKLVSIMLANNEVGTIQPVKELTALTRERKVLFHTDAVQAVGKVPVDPYELGVDFLTISGHKLNAPKGIGALWFRNKVHVCPLIIGGHQEWGRRAGTENTLGIIAFGAAAELALKTMKEEAVRLSRMRDRLEKTIIERIPDVKINGHPEARLPNTLNVSFKYVEGESILYMLDFEGIAVSTGSACSSGSLEPSHVLLAMGLDHGLAHGSVRFSLGRFTTDEEIDYVLDKLEEVIARLRAMSPLCPQN